MNNLPPDRAYNRFSVSGVPFAINGNFFVPTVSPQDAIGFKSCSDIQIIENQFSINLNGFNINDKPFVLCISSTERIKFELCEKIVIATQYRDSTNLINLIEGISSVFIQFKQQFRNWIPSFNLETAVGDQLTILGRIVGFPRHHCNACMEWQESANGTVPAEAIATTCDKKYWLGEINDFTFDDDETYRSFLKARQIYNFTKGTIEDAVNAAKTIFGPTAFLYSQGYGQLIIATGSPQSIDTLKLLPLAYRSIPIPRGVRLRIIDSGSNPFGFGNGWYGFCSGSLGTFLPEFPKQ